MNRAKQEHPHAGERALIAQTQVLEMIASDASIDAVPGS
jgi:hypothetical protein